MNFCVIGRHFMNESITTIAAAAKKTRVLSCKLPSMV